MSDPFLEIDEMVAQKLKSHTLAKSINLPAYIKIVKTVVRDKAEQAIILFYYSSLSNDSICRQVAVLSSGIKENVCEELRDSDFPLQVNRSTRISNKAHLFTFIHFIGGDEIINQFSCCKEMVTTRGQDIFSC